MKNALRFLPVVLLLISAHIPVLAEQPLAARDFAKLSEITDATLSPDGRTLAFIGRFKDRSTLFFKDLQTQKIRRIDPDSMYTLATKKEISSFWWVSNDRVVFKTVSFDIYYYMGLAAVDRNGKNWMGVTGASREQNKNRTFWSSDELGVYGSMSHVFRDRSDRIYLSQASDWEGGQTLHAMDTRTGRILSAVKSPVTLEVKTPDGGVVQDSFGVTDWVFDAHDHPRVGVKHNGNGWTTIYQESTDKPWRTLSDLSTGGKSYFPLGFDHSGDYLYVAVLTRAGTWGVYRYDPGKQRLGPMLIENPNFDIINPHYNSGGVGLLYAEPEHRLVGVRYMTDWLQTAWFDPRFAAVQEAVDRLLPKTNNLFSNWSDDLTKFLVFADSDRNPGTYYLFDLTQHRFQMLGVRAPWIKPEEMSPVYPITFPARDGLTIHGYLTYPKGKDHKNLPLVVFPHGGPFVRDQMDYDFMVQFLASRGYAVLQVNYRGSPGYGEAFYLAGWHQVGKKIQGDITDGVKAMIAGGVADPHRIAILGSSYGGYSALWALENTPELYRCGISLAGVTDWYALLLRQQKAINFGEHLAGEEYARRYWKKTIGDPHEDEASLKAISPLYHVDRLQDPVFIIQGTEDRTVPEGQAKDLVKALQERGANYEAWFVRGEGHSYFHEENREELLKRIEAFLKKNMQ